MIMPGVSCLHPILLKLPRKQGPSPISGKDEFSYVVPCGRCVLCTKRKRREWAIRLKMEAKCYPSDDIAWVTLTYDNENLVRCPRNFTGQYIIAPTLWPKHCPAFMKRLRRRLDYKIRFYACGEYGDKYQRPHMHLIIFGLKHKDWHFIKECWNYGFVKVKSFYDETCGYAAGYIQKKLFGNNVYSGGRIAPFMRCSLKPSIGEKYFTDHYEEIANTGFIRDGKYMYTIPRTFLRHLIENGKVMENDIEDLSLVQNIKWCEFADHMAAQGCTWSDYETNFKILADNEFRRMNVQRNCFDINFGNCEDI